MRDRDGSLSHPEAYNDAVWGTRIAPLTPSADTTATIAMPIWD